MTLSLEKSYSSPNILQQRGATWQDYVAVRDRPNLNWRKIAFYQSWLWVDMGKEGPEHSRFSDLMTIIFGFWAFLHPEIVMESFGRCLIENPETQACAPDLVLYKGENIPHWQPDQPRKIDLRRHRLPDLVGEIGDTTLSLDLDEQKQLYASLGVPEYWVIDVKGLRLFAFGLSQDGLYEPIATSQVLDGLAIALLEKTLERLTTETNTAAANWLMQQLQVKTNTSQDESLRD
ncbi:MAG: Uma2 family endonuclease [Oculatellaceae cyanobacterium Prado106]|jgi:Uma2 family endonuclease|nr:Uma2 family endonuclease [Oculatellaceae cyanobacterium Prado106]